MSPYNPHFHHRKSIRLQGYDYSQNGLYFITICCHQRLHLFGHIADGKMLLNEAGKTAQECWLNIPAHFPQVRLHAFVIMPNHLHGIIEIVGTQAVRAKVVRAEGVRAEGVRAEGVRAENLPPEPQAVRAKAVRANNDSPEPQAVRAENLPPQRRPTGTSKTIGSIVRGFKIGVTKWFRQHHCEDTIWQRDYYEHIIRNEEAYNRITTYIEQNPLKWWADKLCDQQ